MSLMMRPASEDPAFTAEALIWATLRIGWRKWRTVDQNSFDTWVRNALVLTSSNESMVRDGSVPQR